MRISHLHIPDWKHFKNFGLKLCYPADYKDPSKRGKPLDRVCFIGRNGTGKTNLLKILKAAADNIQAPPFGFSTENKSSVATVTHDAENGNRCISHLFLDGDNAIECGYHQKLEKQGEKYIQHYLSANEKFKLYETFLASVLIKGDIDFYTSPRLDGDSSKESGFENPFNLQIQKKTAVFSTFNTENSIKKAFKERIMRRAVFFSRIAELNEEMPTKRIKEWVDRVSPLFLSEIKILWDNILKFAKLYLDIKLISGFEIKDDMFNFEIKHENTQKIIPFVDLSTGMREFMLKIGSLALYYQQCKELNTWLSATSLNVADVKDNIFLVALFMDEPENGLFVDMLYNYFDNYLNFITPENTQLFVATHSPIIASQFEPEERVILYFDEEGNVRARQGSAPIGDDVNDMMTNDFGTDVYGRHKIEQAEWKTYRDILMRLEMNLDDEETQTQLIKKGLELAQKRGFHGENELKSYNRKLKKPKTPK